MNIGKAFTYVFEDPDYIKKIGIAALMSLIPVAGVFILLGWSIEITRRVIRGEQWPLPEWNDYGRLFMQGLKAFGLSFVYLLPVILINACVQISSIPLQASLDNETMAMAFSGIMLVGACLTIILAIAVSLLLVPALGIYADTDNLGAAFRLGDVFGLLRANVSAYLMAIVGVFLASFVASLGLIACCIGVFVTAALASAVNSHLYGQAYLAARGASTRM
jgi:hypothetical protein